MDKAHTGNCKRKIYDLLGTLTLFAEDLPTLTAPQSCPVWILVFGMVGYVVVGWGMAAAGVL